MAVVLIAAALVLLALVLFPWTGLAMLPVAGAAGLALVAWLVVLLTRRARGLPERRIPGEPR